MNTVTSNAHGRRPESDLGFAVAAAALFLVAAGLTIAWSRSMADMAPMPMPGGWSMSMAWMRMPGQSWLAAGASFLAMWTVMMVAMMLPSLLPLLRRTRGDRHCAQGDPGPLLIGAIALGYFFLWALLGLPIFAAGVGLASTQMAIPALASSTPNIIRAIIVAAGLIQLGAWKQRQLHHCRQLSAGAVAAPQSLPGALRLGLRAGITCIASCANLTALLLALGVMDLWAMALVTAAITLERVAAQGERLARATGALVILYGLIA